MTTIVTIVKATPTVLATACGLNAESTSKGVPGQFDKLIGLINQAPEDKDLIIEASLLKGVFKALGEDSKDASTFKCVLSLKGWSLMQVADDWTIYRGNGTGIVLTKNTYNWETQKEVEEMVDYSHEYVPTSWEQVVADELGVEPSKLPKPVYPVIVYTGEPKLPTSIQLGVVYSEVSIETDQGLKVAKYLSTDIGIITCKGTRFESVETLINAVKAAFKVETQEVSKANQQPQEVVMETKPLTFCQLMKAEWIPSKDTWEASNLIARMRATWKSGKYATDDRQAVFMKEFVAQVATLPQGIEMPNSAFLTAYDLVRERLTGIKTETPKFVSSMTAEEAASSFEGNHTVEIVTQTITKKFEPVALPEHLKKSQVKELPKPETRSYKEILLEKASKSVQELTKDSWDMQDFFNLESICESFDGEEQYQFHVNMIRMWIKENTQEDKGIFVSTQEKSCEDEEMSEGKVTIKNMLGKRYTLEVFFTKDKTLWINTQSGESFNSLSDLCMVHDKEYFSHEFFVEGQPADDTIIRGYQLGDILAVTYDDEHNEYAYYGSDFITVKAVVVEGGFQLGEGEDAEVFATIHELCNKAFNGNYEGTPEVRVVTAEEVEAILEKEYNIGMGIE